MATKLETINAMPQGTEAELKAKLAALTAFAAEKPATTKGQLSFKVSEKGALSIYGLGQFPLTQYPKNMLRVLDVADDIRAFIDAHHDEFSWEKAPKEKKEPYTAEQQAADYALITGKTKGSEEQIQFATQRLDARMEKRFGTK